jgi:hypothetical protein
VTTPPTRRSPYRRGAAHGPAGFCVVYLDKGLTLDAEGCRCPRGRGGALSGADPAGTADYRFLMFGHGMGGSFHDDLFDHDLAVNGVGKVNIEFHGWTERT